MKYSIRKSNNIATCNHFPEFEQETEIECDCLWLYLFLSLFVSVCVCVGDKEAAIVLKEWSH